MGMFGKLKGKGRGEGASDELVEDIDGMSEMAAFGEEDAPPGSQAEEAIPSAPAVPEDPPDADDEPLDDDMLSLFEEEEDTADPLVKDMAAEAEEVDAEELLAEILSLTEALDSA